jgi:hypothetical protein
VDETNKKNNQSNHSQPPQQSPTPPTTQPSNSHHQKGAIIDSCTTSHMFCEKHSTQNKTPTQQPIHDKLPDGAYMHSTHEDNIDLPSNNLASAATKTSIFPALDTSLISVGQFCDASCTAVFNQHKAEIIHNNKIILTGTRSPLGLWYYQLPTPTTADPPSANASIANTSAEHIQFLHAAVFCPVTST